MADTEKEIAALTELAAQVVERALRGGADVAEAIARSGSELSTKVRLDEPELVEEAAHKSLGMRVIKQKRVALTSTCDLTPRGIDRFVADALELVDISQEDPFAGPADPALVASGALPDLQLYDPAGGRVTAAQAIELARAGERAAREADPRITNSDGATFARTAGAFAMVLSGDEALKAVCETENLDMGEFIERELVRVIKQRVHAAHDIAARTRRPGTSGKTKE